MSQSGTRGMLLTLIGHDRKKRRYGAGPLVTKSSLGELRRMIWTISRLRIFLGRSVDRIGSGWRGSLFGESGVGEDSQMSAEMCRICYLRGREGMKDKRQRTRRRYLGMILQTRLESEWLHEP